MTDTKAFAKSLIQPAVTLKQSVYSPSWVDRLSAIVNRLPIPFWVTYGGLWLALFLPYSALKWWEAAYPVGTFNGFHFLLTSTGIYLLALLHYLDKTAGNALDTFRSMLTVNEQEYQRLHYRLTTLPGRRTFWVSILIGLWFGPSFLYSRPLFPQLRLATSNMSLGVEILFFCFIWSAAATFVYHTIHQLRIVHQIYIQHAQINLFQPGPLYAFSRLTAHTAIGITIINYVWALPQYSTGVPAAGADVTIFFILIALIAFFWPLRGAHCVLAAEKQRLQSETAQRVAKLFAELDRCVDSGTLEQIAALKTAIDSLRAKQEVIAKISTWPWQIETMRGVVTAASLPLAIWVIQRLLEHFVFTR